ncbi:hypothetical protein L0F63_004046 [Massospora cicadina]|nr:hypothetical protein L0F63_004046 [Massospora cicadina]
MSGSQSSPAQQSADQSQSPPGNPSNTYIYDPQNNQVVGGQPPNNQNPGASSQTTTQPPSTKSPSSPGSYNDSEVLDQSMRDPQHPDECQLAPTPPGRTFHTDLNKMLVTGKGQCTEWADGRYFQLTGRHVDFVQNAFIDATNWDDAARKAGWKVTQTPFTPSIIVIKNTVPGYEGPGHVAVVESVQGSKVCTSNWNKPTPMKLTLTYFDTAQAPRDGFYFIAPN